MPHKLLVEILEKNYTAIKQAYPGDGRRQRILRVLHSNWPSPTTQIDNGTLDLNLNTLDHDPYDPLLETEAPGLLLRTDFSNEQAWQTFLSKFTESQKDLLDSPDTSDNPSEFSSPPQDDGDVEMSTTNDGNESDSSSEDGVVPEAVITVYNPPTTEERTALTNISNITALRLFNDVDVRPAVQPPPDTKSRYDPQNVLVNKNGWQEVYTGKNIWIYDRKSVDDESVRVVAQSGDLYGTATGDSWRARISHIAELQFNTSYLDMKIDFGGLDRWDPEERARNLSEAATA